MEQRDFFISYTSADEPWARWIADVLKSNGYTVYVQALDIKPGDNFLEKMNEFLKHSRNFIAVWSERYPKSRFCMAELQSAFYAWNKETMDFLLPVRIDNHPLEPLYAGLVYVNLSDMGAASKTKLMNAVRDRVPRPVSSLEPSVFQAYSPDEFNGFREKLCFGTLVQIVWKADNMLKQRETVQMLLDLVLIYSYPPIKGRRGEDFIVTDKIASNLAHRKVNLPQNIVQAAREDEGVLSSAQEYVEDRICRELSHASITTIINNIIVVVRDDPSIPSEKQQEFISSANDALANKKAFSSFFGKVLLYSLQVNNNRLENR